MICVGLPGCLPRWTELCSPNKATSLVSVMVMATQHFGRLYNTFEAIKYTSIISSNHFVDLQAASTAVPFFTMQTHGKNTADFVFQVFESPLFFTFLTSRFLRVEALHCWPQQGTLQMAEMWHSGTHCSPRGKPVSLLSSMSFLLLDGGSWEARQHYAVTGYRKVWGSFLKFSFM